MHEADVRGHSNPLKLGKGSPENVDTVPILKGEKSSVRKSWKVDRIGVPAASVHSASHAGYTPVCF